VDGNEDGHWFLQRLFFNDYESVGKLINGLGWSQEIARVQREGPRGRYEERFERLGQ